MSTYWNNLVVDRLAGSERPSRQCFEYATERDGKTYRVTVAIAGDKVDVLLTCW